MRKPNSVCHRIDGTSAISINCKGRVLDCVIDSQDYDAVKGYHWHGFDNGTVIYAATSILKSGQRTTLLMHSIILPRIPLVDHRDFNGLNNRRKNLRPLSASASTIHTRKRRNTASKFRGVRFDARRARFTASVRAENVSHWLGSFVDEEDAAKAYDAAALKYHGTFANLNFPSKALQRKDGPK